MTKQELDALRQKNAEARKAMKEAIDEHKAGKPEGVEITIEEWRTQSSEKLQKAREAFAESCNVIASAEIVAQDERELEEWEQRMSRPDDSFNVHNPDSPLPPDRQGVKPSECALLQEADAIEHRSGHIMTQTDRNVVQSMRNLAIPYLKLGLNAEQKAAYREWFGAALRHVPQDGRYQTAQQKLLESAPEQFALLTSTGETGGYMVPEDFQAQVIRDLAGFSVFRSYARVERTSRDVMVWPSIVSPTAANLKKGYSSRYAGSWKAQRTASGGATALTVQNQPLVEQERIPICRWEPDATELSVELMEDPIASIETILAEIIAETKGLDETAAFTNGDGQGQPTGIDQESFTAVNSGAATALKYNPAAKGLLALYGTLPAQYRANASWCMNSLSYTAALGIETTGNNIVFPPNALPNTMITRPVMFDEFMPDVAANSYPIILGDFRYYIIADRTELRIQRLVERAAPNVAFLAYARLGGKTVRTGAFVRQKVAA